MNAVSLTPWILSEIQNNISEVIEDVTKVVNRVHHVVLWVVTILHSNDIVEMSPNILTGGPTMESDWMQLLGDLCDQ